MDSQPHTPEESESPAAGYHVPVLLNETMEALAIEPNGVYVDCTFGGGGHSRKILEQLGPGGKLIAFDQDDDAVRNIPADDRLLFVPQNFRHLQRFLRLHKVTEVDGILADLGVSSHQFDEAERGFSTRFDAALDMRMDQRQAFTAADLIRTWTEPQLHKMLEQFGEVTNAKTLARTLVEQRMLTPIKTIREFKQAVGGVVKGIPQKYFAQVFQAIRIAVNDEMGALKEMLEQTPALLASGGRLAIITFHSLEDRMVKNFIKEGSTDPVPVDDLYGGKPASALEAVNKKPITAGADELNSNPRSRSAKLRVAQKK